MSDTLQLVLNGKITPLYGIPATTTLLDWLREHARLCGTKEGCAEGDCGACTVVIEKLGADGSLQRRAVNACLTMVGQVDGIGVRTVEGLAAGDGALHPVQQAFVETEGTQCGFCTPGFVMSAYAFATGGEPAELPLIHDALAGNLCRCTGYRPIVEAVSQVTPLAEDPLARSSAALAQALRKVTRERGASFEIDEQRFDTPRAIAEALALRAKHPQAVLLAGGTDVGLRVSQKREHIPHVIYLGNVAELAAVEDGKDGLRLGAGVSCTDAFARLTTLYPGIGTYLTRFGSRQIRNMGTLGGNLGTASPIGDALPVLLALDARIVVGSQARGTREIPIEEYFKAYRQTALAADELIQAVLIPKPAPNTHLFADKVSKRRDQDISAICGAFHVTLEKQTVREIRLAFGGMAATPRRAYAAEKVLRGRELNEAAIAAAITALHDDFQPLSDWRGSAEYRLAAAEGLLQRLYLRLGKTTVSVELDAL